ncbi:MAG: sigma 54-interacting transcriptional regulator [Methyloversatilis discipulorum]|uniref:sigma-54 interaction domain-containing protein n=1 Tax=Methyloversatilis discipulorum TaxID=1119528 RepID=UPI0026EE9291|nr:sigma 54-interacting transcriptional regulator [Methyloversatilis discipulorum]MBT9516013.1 sigma 54-interacting transcriptional regulator [Methyloversatilis discipulorum]
MNDITHTPQDPDSPTLIAFENPQELSLLIRATAVVFADPKSKALLSRIERIAPSDATVLITGETGTGKELVARHVHALSHRRNAPFVAINCGAFSETLIESELFGYERGAFTGAMQSRAGWFETAHGGTLFLDEIGDLPLPMQVKLLRVLQEREVVRVGSRKPIPIDVRLIAATNVKLQQAVEAGHFREDLYYRLQVISLPLVPLRDRPLDILPLTQHFMKLYSRQLRLHNVKLSDEALRALQAYPWPGNIRELENVVHRALLVCHNSEVSEADLQLPQLGQSPLVRRIEALAQSAPVAASTVAPASPGGGSATSDDAGDPLERGFRSALQALLDEGRPDLLGTLMDWIVRDAYAFGASNQIRTAQVLGISRHVLRTHLRRSGLLASQTDAGEEDEGAESGDALAAPM